MRQLLALPFGALFCALVIFIWGYIAWMVLPFYGQEMKPFENEAAVSAVLVENAASGHAIYSLPHPKSPANVTGAGDEADNDPIEATPEVTPEAQAPEPDAGADTPPADAAPTTPSAAPSEPAAPAPAPAPTEPGETPAPVEPSDPSPAPAPPAPPVVTDPAPTPPARPAQPAPADPAPPTVVEPETAQPAAPMREAEEPAATEPTTAEKVGDAAEETTEGAESFLDGVRRTAAGAASGMADAINEDSSALDEARKRGPFVFAVVRPGGSQWGMPESLLNHAIILLISSLILGVLLIMASIRNYFGRVFFVVLVATFASFTMEAQQWNWFEFPLRFTVISMLDTIIGWTLGGLFLAAIVVPRKRKVMVEEKS